MLGGRIKAVGREAVPWVLLAAVAGVAAWHVLDFSEARDTEFPGVVRPFFNRRPPAAYRLAEPGDTLDRIALYLSAGVVALSSMAIFCRRRFGADLMLWPSALALGLAVAWHASTPGPGFDGWHGLGWREIFDPLAPLGLRISLGVSGLVLAGVVATNLVRAARRSVTVSSRASLTPHPNPPPQGGRGPDGGRAPGAGGTSEAGGTPDAARASLAPSPLLGEGWGGGAASPVTQDDLFRTSSPGADLSPLALLAVAGVLILLRQFELPGVEPAGYWPRAAFDLGLVAFLMVLVRARPLEGVTRRARPALGMAATWAVLVFAGVGLTLYHRPLSRLRPVVPGRIYISAMPTYRGLAIEQGRLHFRTIINLFDESSDQASPGHLDEIRFVRDHGLRYLGSPSDGMESDRFLDETLALAQDPEAWPILVHCHGCMDRSPAWMGIYRFLVEGVPLADVFKEIERHRGSRPKSVVTLQYLRKLPGRAPEKFADDPTGRLLVRCASGVDDPFARPDWNRTRSAKQVVTRINPEPPTRRP